jgi:hypothetical protein
MILVRAGVWAKDSHERYSSKLIEIETIEQNDCCHEAFLGK